MIIRPFALAGALLLIPAALAAQPIEECSNEALLADVHACDAQIRGAPEPRIKAAYLQRRAYAFVEKGEIELALKDLDEAVALDPSLPDALHERAYVLGELGEFRRALQDLESEVALRPSHPEAYEERAYVRHNLGNFEGAYADRLKAETLRPGVASAVLYRAEAALWLGRFDEAKADTARALDLAQAAGETGVVATARDQLKAIDLWRAGSGTSDSAKTCEDAMAEGKVEQANLIGDCTRAFLESRTPSKRAGFLTVRSLAWVVGARDRKRWMADAEAAVAVDPANGDWHANLGGVYEDFGRHKAALRVFDRAVVIRPSYVALAGRAAARYSLKDEAGAFADAKRSFELKPNVVALTVLGDLSFDRKDEKSAKLYWMGAYHLGSSDDRLIARLRRIGIEHPENEPR